MLVALRNRTVVYWQTTPLSERACLLAVLLAALAVWLLFLSDPLRHYEAYTVASYAKKPFFLTFTDLCTPNNHMLPVGFVIRLFGDAEWVVRLPALAA